MDKLSSIVYDLSMNNWGAAQISLTLEHLRALRGDTTDVEIKNASRGLPENLAQTVCAFANMPDGGTIIFGVDEHSNFAVVGVSNPARLIAGIVSQARASVSPTPHIEAYTVKIDGLQVVVAEVVPLPLSERPARLLGRAYLRQADGDYAMHEHELRMLEQQKNAWNIPVQFDAQPVPGTSIADLDTEIVDAYLDQVRKVDKRLSLRNNADILHLTNVVTAAGELTLAGLYALGDYPQEFAPALAVTAAVQLPRGARARTKNLRDFSGPLPILLDDIIGWCEENVATLRHYRPDGNMEDDYELPMQGIRELVANALVHRDLSQNSLGVGKSIQIRLNSKNLMILSPGGLRGISLEQLKSKSHAQAAVNQHLYSIAKKLTTADGAAIIEGEGGGIAATIAATEEYGLTNPTFIDTGVQFTTLIWRPNIGAPATTTLPGEEINEASQFSKPLMSNRELVLNVLRSNGAISARTLEKLTGLSPVQVRYVLRNEMQQQSIEMIGARGSKNTKYRLSRETR